MSRGRASRRAIGVLTLVGLLCALALALAACGAEHDPFTGVWWEPATGRRIEIRRDGDAYSFLYGVEERRYPATRAGDELRIRAAMGGTIVVKATDDDGLDLVIGGRTSGLKPVPQHQ